MFSMFSPCNHKSWFLYILVLHLILWILWPSVIALLCLIQPAPGFVACGNVQVCRPFFTRTHAVRRLRLLVCTTHAPEGTLVPQAYESDKEAWWIFVNWTPSLLTSTFLTWSSFQLHVELPLKTSDTFSATPTQLKHVEDSKTMNIIEYP